MLRAITRYRVIFPVLGGVAWICWWAFHRPSLVFLAVSLVLFGWWLFEPLPERNQRSNAVLIGLILAAALIPRAVNLERAPYGVYHDETLFPFLGLKVLHEHAGGLLAETSDYFHATYFSLAIQALPGLLVQPLLGARVASLILGIGSLLGAYLLAARLFDRTVGVIALIILASSYWHMAYSRMGYPYMQPIFLVPWALYTIVQGVTTRNRFLQFLAGIALGGSLLVYTPARIVLPVAAVWLAYRVAVGETPGKEAILCCAAIALGATLILSPYLRTQGAQELFFRFHQATLENQGPLRLLGQYGLMSVSGRELLVAQVRAAAEVYLRAGGLFAVEHGPRHALLDPVSLGLAVLGLIAALARLRDSSRFLVVVWIAATFVFGQLLTDVPRAAYRAAPLLPALAICGGLAGRAIANLMQRLRVPAPVAICGTAIALEAAILPVNLLYLRDYLDQRKRDPLASMARLIGASDPEPIYYVVAPEAFATTPEFQIFAGSRTLRDASSLIDSLRDESNRTRGAVFVLYPSMVTAVEPIRRCHPGAVVLSETSGSPDQPVLAVVVSRTAFAADLPCEEAAQGPGLLANYYHSQSWDGPVVKQRVEDWPYRYELATPIIGSVEWRGYLRAPVPGTYRFRLLTREGATGNVAIAPGIELSSLRDVSTHLDPGEHAISIRCRPERPGSFCWLQWEPPGGPETLIPPQFLSPPSVAPTRRAIVDGSR